MKPYNHVPIRSRGAGLAVGLAFFLPVFLFASDPADAAAKAGDKAANQTASKIEDYRSSNTEMNKAEVKAALAQIDAELEHLDALADAAPTSAQKTDIEARYKALKERRRALEKDFTQARYEAFKADLKAETDRVSAWAKETFSTRPAASEAATTTSATAETTAAKIAEYQTEATDINKAEVKASLARLDADIELLEAKIDAITDPGHKAELKQRLSALKDRRSQLNGQFRKARYDALVADVKSEWNRLTN